MLGARLCSVTAGDSHKRRRHGAPGMPAATTTAGNSPAIASRQRMCRLRPARSRTKRQRSHQAARRQRPRARSEVASGLPGNVAAARVAVDEATEHGLPRSARCRPPAHRSSRRCYPMHPRVLPIRPTPAIRSFDLTPCVPSAPSRSSCGFPESSTRRLTCRSRAWPSSATGTT